MSRGGGFNWVINLDAEFELADPTTSLSDRVREQLARHASQARSLLGPADRLLSEDAPLVGRPGRAWCPTPRALAVMRQAGVTPEPHPSVEVLRHVNHRRFGVALGGGVPGQAYVEDRAALDAALGEREHPWLLKRPLSFAGRGQIRVYGALDAVQEKWVDASLRRDGLVVEPFVDIEQEFSIHGVVDQRGVFELGRPCVQTNSDRGVFRAARRAEPGDLAVAERAALCESAARVATALAGAAYFGPFGVDAYRYRERGGTRLCALGEINARYTMAFAVGFDAGRS